jgi:flagellin
MSIGAVINTNIMSLNAQRNLSSSQGELATSLERLSSGLRINSAKDDAAGLAIAERFTSQINGQNQAVRNSNDGISFAQTAEGALDEVSNLLQRVRELAVQSANDTNSASDREALNQEVEQAVAEIQRIAESTQFNGQNVLDGTLSDLTFQVGANRGQTISVDGVDSQTDQLGVNVVESSAVNTNQITTLADGDITINGEDVAVGSVSNVQDVVDAINAISDDTDVEAVRVTAGDVVGNTGATNGDISASATTAGTSVMMTINGTDITADGSAVGDVSTLVGLINAESEETGVTASASGNGELLLTGSDEIEVTNVDSGIDAGSGTGSDATYDRGFELVSDLDVDITVGEDTAGDALAVGLTNESDGSIKSTSDAGTRFDVDGMSVLSRDEASDAIRTADYAIQQVSGLRSELGAVQNRFEATIANLSVSAENLSAARSRIQDTDFAKETAALTRAQILQQAGTSILSQANAVPQTVLGLLQ